MALLEQSAPVGHNGDGISTTIPLQDSTTVHFSFSLTRLQISQEQALGLFLTLGSPVPTQCLIHSEFWLNKGPQRGGRPARPSGLVLQGHTSTCVSSPKASQKGPDTYLQKELHRRCSSPKDDYCWKKANLSEST